MKKTVKTNAMRILDQAHIPYEVYTYPHENMAVDGIHVAELLNEPVQCVFKTLLTVTAEHHYYVFVLPVHLELDLKKCAKAVNERASAAHRVCARRLFPDRNEKKFSYRIS